MVQTMSKQLGEYLQEQQEPFILDQYLLERGSLRSSNFSSSTRDFRCCSGNSTKFLKRSSSCGEKKRKRVILGCSKTVRALFNKLVITISSHNHKIKNGASDDHNKTNKAQDNVVDTNDDDKFSSASSTTVFNSCSDTDDAEDKKVSADTKMKLDFLEDSKQLSPVSVLEETESSDDVSPDHKYQENLKVKKQEEFSRPSVSKSKPEKASDHSQYFKNKKAIQQTKQLLFDCVKEVVENQNRGTEKIQRIMGAEQLWELLRENIWLWSQDTIDETNIHHLIHLDLLDSYEQSSGFDLHIRETGKEIGDAILEDTINEIAAYMYNCSASK